MPFRAITVIVHGAILIGAAALLITGIVRGQLCTASVGAAIIALFTWARTSANRPPSARHDAGSRFSGSDYDDDYTEA